MDSSTMPVEDDVRPYSISPTDISQFIRLNQSRRYLYLRLQERDNSSGFHRAVREQGLQLQSIPPLLTRSGREFEKRVQDDIEAAEGQGQVNFKDAAAGAGNRDTSNALVVQMARALRPGETLFIFQARLIEQVEGWAMRGDVDILRLARDEGGALAVMIADMKASATPKVEHRLQVAFYQRMIEGLFARSGIEHQPVRTAILYRGDQHPPAMLAQAERELREEQAAAAQQWFLTSAGFLEIVSDQQAYLDAVHDLVTGPGAVARQLIAANEEEVPYHLSYLCDGCLYNALCMKWSAQRDDLSLVPFISDVEKQLLAAKGIRTVRDLALLKDLTPRSDGKGKRLVSASGKAGLVRELSSNRQIGPRLDELVHRARSYRAARGDEIEAISNIPGKGYSSLPPCDATHNPNLVRIYIDAQHDYLEDRVYLLGALIVAAENGEVKGRHSVVRLAEKPIQSSQEEQELLVEWIDATLRAAVKLAAVDEGRTAPVHLIFFNRYGQRVLLDALARHLSPTLGTTPLFDFITQLAGYEAPIASYLEEELRERKNYPLVAQSLQAVARYLRFDWNTPLPFSERFRARLFDDRRTMIDEATGEAEWYTSNSRFNSQIPLEYAYSAWDDLGDAPERGQDLFADYRGRSMDELRAFQQRRLEAIEHIANQFNGDPGNVKPLFTLPELKETINNARNMANALHEFVLIERHVTLGEWKSIRTQPPDRRVLMGETLLATYAEADQPEGMAAENSRIAANMQANRDQLAAYQRDHDGADPPRGALKKADTEMSGFKLRLRLDASGLDVDEPTMLGLTGIREDEYVVINPLTKVFDPGDGQLVEYTPRPRELMRGTRAIIQGISPDGLIDIEITGSPGGESFGGFIFASYNEPFNPGQVYTIDKDPNSWPDYYNWMTSKQLPELAEKGPETEDYNALFNRLVSDNSDVVNWPEAASEGQQRFFAGLVALHEAGKLHDFEPSKQEYIGSRGDAAVLLVQGPPGTGKSYSTAFAVFARIQGAIAAGQDYRVVVACHTHAAIEVLMGEMERAQEIIERWKRDEPEIFGSYFDDRLLDVKLFRIVGKDAGGEAEEGDEQEATTPAQRIVKLPSDPSTIKKGHVTIADRLGRAENRWCVVGSTPSGIYKVANTEKKRVKGSTIFSRHFIDCLVLDEASQMSLPGGVMAALPLKRDGQLIVVGDHRQMAPIVKHDWDREPRRTFKEYKSYQALFSYFLELPAQQPIPVIRFAESFRLHQSMAEFLRAAIYQQDKIPYFSQRTEQLKLPAALQARLADDPFVAAALAPEHPMVVVVHDENESQQRNLFEQRLIAPILQALADANLDPVEGMGVVVPHRAQRADLQEVARKLQRPSDGDGLDEQKIEQLFRESVDVVERFQGDERKAIVISATESDPFYLLLAGKFLFEPTRLTVAISRAKNKLVLVASRQIFSAFSADEQTFQNSLLWKRLLRDTCTLLLWEGEIEGKQVQVWGNE